MVQSAAFAICNLVGSSDERIFKELKKSGVGTVLFKLLKNSSTSPDVVTELAWILTYFTVNDQSIEYLFLSGITISFAVELLARCFELPESVQVVTPLVRTLGIIHNYYYLSPATFPKGGQTRKHCLLAMFPKGRQTRKPRLPAIFPKGGQTRKHCFLAMFPIGEKTRKHCFLAMLPFTTAQTTVFTC